MTDHMHKWEVRWRADGPEWVCTTQKKLSRFDDDHVLLLEEITRSVNATERLSAEDAGKLKDMHYPVAYEDDEMCFNLYDYIAILKGLPLHPHTQNAAALEGKNESDT